MKGKLKEIISKAIYADDPTLYTVGYRDLQVIKELPLLEFINVSDNFNLIPLTRIIYIKRGKEVLYKKYK